MTMPKLTNQLVREQSPGAGGLEKGILDAIHTTAEGSPSKQAGPDDNNTSIVATNKLTQVGRFFAAAFVPV